MAEEMVARQKKTHIRLVEARVADAVAGCDEASETVVTGGDHLPVLHETEGPLALSRSLVACPGRHDLIDIPLGKTGEGEKISHVAHDLPGAYPLDEGRLEPVDIDL